MVLPHGAHAPFDSSARYYDIFEKHRDGTAAWREAIFGLESARSRLAELAGGSTNEFFLMDLYSDKIVG